MDFELQWLGLSEDGQVSRVPRGGMRFHWNSVPYVIRSAIVFGSSTTRSKSSSLCLHWHVVQHLHFHTGTPTEDAPLSLECPGILDCQTLSQPEIPTTSCGLGLQGFILGGGHLQPCGGRFIVCHHIWCQRFWAIFTNGRNFKLDLRLGSDKSHLKLAWILI